MDFPELKTPRSWAGPSDGPARPCGKEMNGMLEEKLTEWVHKVLTAYETAGMTDTLQMDDSGC